MYKPGKIKMIPTGFISPSSNFLRSENENEDMKMLVKSIMKNGIIQPIIVKKLEKNNYEVICGNRRLYAAKILDMQKIPCIIKDVGIHKSAVFSVCDNTIRRNLTCFEQAHYINSIIEEYKFTISEAAQKLCIPTSKINQKLELLNICKELQQKIERLGFSEFQIMQIVKLPPQKHEPAVEEIAAQNMNDEETYEFVKNLLNPSTEKFNRFIVSDIRLFSNSIDKALSIMKSAGISANCEKEDSQNSICYHITIPKDNEKFILNYTLDTNENIW